MATYFRTLQNKEYAELAREAKVDGKIKAAAIEAARVAEVLKANPHIGMIVSKGKPMFYTGAGDNMTANVDSLV